MKDEKLCECFIKALLDNYAIKYEELPEQEKKKLLSMVLTNTTMDINEYIHNNLKK